MVNENNNINQYVDKKPFEIVQEVNNEIPSYEEFMKSYESDVNVNYDDLNSSDISLNKGYGPIGEYSWKETRDGTEYIGCGQVAQTQYSPGSCTCDTRPSRFCLNIKCYNWVGDGGSKYACSTSRALQYAHDLEDNNWPNAEVISDEVLYKCATLVREAVRKYDGGNRVKGYVKVEGRFWTGYEWSYNY